MTTFDSTKISLRELLREITEGKIQLPDFQRGWVWDDDHIRDLLVSVARSFPVGAVMLLETGGHVQFQTRPVEGIETLAAKQTRPERLILDGQQRLTTLTQTLALQSPVQTRTNKGKPIQRYYYIDIQKALDETTPFDEAIIAVDENKKRFTNFGRDLALDLSTTEKECRELMFPCNQIMNADQWEFCLHQTYQDKFSTYMNFRSKFIDAFRNYQLPVIALKKETSKEAVCLVFEKVNTGGVQLSVFELVTASYAAEGYNLRDDWFGSKERQVPSRKQRLAVNPLLKDLEAPEFLQTVTLLHTREQRQQQLAAGKTGKQVRPVSAKRSDLLDLPLAAWQKYADDLEKGFLAAGLFLKKECFYGRRDMPYRTQLLPLAAVLSQLGERWREPQIYRKLSRWFWCGVLGELYGGAVETRIANDFEQLLQWFEDDEAVPRTVSDAFFQPERLDTLRSRLSAAYKAINVLVVREGAADWFWNASIRELDSQEISLDIHHIFPKAWCEKQGFSRDQYDSILNKTPLSYKANRKIGGDAPSAYLARIQSEKQVALDNPQMDTLLQTHALCPTLLRQDHFELFIADRKQRLMTLISQAMGKQHLPEASSVDE